MENFIIKIGTDYMNIEEKYILLNESYRKMSDLMNNMEKEKNEKLNLCNQKKIVELDLDEYVSKILSEKPDIIKNNSYINDIYLKIKQNSS